MCGIAGFSLSPNSKINTRKLANKLLAQIESRGNQASGYAFHSPSSVGYYKRDVSGSKLNLKGLSRKASSVILHTRYATHGSIREMVNNHPVASPSQAIQLVHNGVIYNHDRIRSDIKHKLPEVDSSVIPALLQQEGTEGFAKLDGDAAVAWLDESQRGILHVARISHSPLTVAQLTDGSFVFASTRSLLKSALDACKLEIDFIREIPELVKLTVRDGRIDGYEPLPETDDSYKIDYSTVNTGRFRNMTAGGKGSESDYESIVFGKKTDTYHNPTEDDFQYYLTDFVQVDDMFYTYSGELLGDEDYMRDKFEDELGIFCTISDPQK